MQPYFHPKHFEAQSQNLREKKRPLEEVHRIEQEKNAGILKFLLNDRKAYNLAIKQYTMKTYMLLLIIKFADIQCRS